MGDLLSRLGLGASPAQAELVPHDPRAAALLQGASQADPALYSRLNDLPTKIPVWGTEGRDPAYERTPQLFGYTDTYPNPAVSILPIAPYGPYTDPHSPETLIQPQAFERKTTLHELGHLSKGIFGGGPMTRELYKRASKDEISPDELVADIAGSQGVPPGAPEWLTPAFARSVLNELRGKAGQ